MINREMKVTAEMCMGGGYIVELNNNICVAAGRVNMAVKNKLGGAGGVVT